MSTNPISSKVDQIAEIKSIEGDDNGDVEMNDILKIIRR